MKGMAKPTHMSGLRKNALMARPGSSEPITSGNWARG